MLDEWQLGINRRCSVALLMYLWIMSAWFTDEWIHSTTYNVVSANNSKGWLGL